MRRAEFANSYVHRGRSVIETAPNKAASPSRLGWVDIAKGICIILVVYGHAVAGVREASLIPTDGWLNASFYVIYTFHMPAFFLLSGLFIAPRVAKSFPRFVARIPQSILWPYLLWGVALLATKSLAGDYVNDVLRRPLSSHILAMWYEPPGPFWFLYVLAGYQLLGALLAKGRLMVLGIVLGLAGLVFTASPDNGLPSVLSQALHFFLFFMLGVLAGARPERLQGESRFDHLALAGALLVALLAFAGWGWTAGFHYYDYRALPAAFAGVAGVVILSRTRMLNGQAWLTAIGARSLPIYLMHVFVTSGVRIAAGRIMPGLDPLVIVAASFVLGLALPILAYEIAVRLRLNGVLGFGRAPGQAGARKPKTAPGAGDAAIP